MEPPSRPLLSTVTITVLVPASTFRGSTARLGEVQTKLMGFAVLMRKRALALWPTESSLKTRVLGMNTTEWPMLAAVGGAAGAAAGALTGKGVTAGGKGRVPGAVISTSGGALVLSPRRTVVGRPARLEEPV